MKPISVSALTERARRVFGIERFRPGQLELTQAVLAGQDALGILRTGGGKSLCFQLASLFVPLPVLVVTPLISLAEDQTDKLEARRVAARRVDSTLPAAEAREALGLLGRGQLELVYVTPERLQNPEFLALLRDVGCSLIVVDEAHCVSQWGHDFRPAYLRLRQAVRALGSPPVLALTATATPEVERDIAEQLALRGPMVFRGSSARLNLQLSVSVATRRRRRTPSWTRRSPRSPAAGSSTRPPWGRRRPCTSVWCAGTCPRASTTASCTTP
jgi:ATP-dependent DNA helicase RecQ